MTDRRMPPSPEKMSRLSSVGPINMPVYMAKGKEVADGIKVPNQLILKLGDDAGLCRRARVITRVLKSRRGGVQLLWWSSV